MDKPDTFTEILAQVIAPPSAKYPAGFAAGIVLWDDKVVEAADIIRRMRGWDRARVRTYCEKNGWRVSVVHQLERAAGRPS